MRNPLPQVVGIDSSPYEALCAQLGGDLSQLDALLSERLASSNEPLIGDVARHLVNAGGKRIRPLLTLAAARATGYDGRGHLHLAAAVELLHSATLLHDDVVDASALRRGETTAHMIWGNKTSILVGDFLFSRSFALMVECGSLPVLETLASAAATIAEGEVMQLSTARDLDVDDSRYLQVLRAKTAAMFGAAAEVGALIGRAPPDIVLAFREYGIALGTAFQLADDALDYDGSEQDTGKGVGDDFNEGKATMPALLAYRAGDSDERDFWRRTITEGDRRESDFVHALDLADRTGAVLATRVLADTHAHEAKSAILTIPDSPLRSTLCALADYAVRRRS